MQAKDRMAKARAQLLRDNPFFGVIALRMDLKEDPTCPTAYTDGKTIGYSPAFVDGLSLDQAKGLLAHEILHVTNLHHFRRGPRDPRKWNVAGDKAINPMLVESGFALPPNGLVPNELLSAERWYGRHEQEDQQNDSDNRSESESEHNESPGDDNDSGGPESEEKSDGDPSGTSDDQSDSPNESESDDSGSASTQTDDSPTDSELTGWGEVRDAPPEITESETKQSIIEAVMVAKGIGSVPGFAERLVKSWVNPEATWDEILARYFADAKDQDTTWARPNRRYVSRGFYFPSAADGKLSDIVVVADTSGSIDGQLFDRFMAEIKNLSDAYELEVTVIYCDTAVDPEKTQIIRPGEPFEPRGAGWGGTAFRPAFEYIDGENLDPQVVIYFTDGGSYDFGPAPDYDVIWAEYGSFDWPDGHYPFGEKVRVS